MKPMFIPLKAEYFAAFVDGTKTNEYRMYGDRYNERTCAIGREVVISRGYGKAHRRRGKIVGFKHALGCNMPEISAALENCYGTSDFPVAVITIKLESDNV